MELFLKKEKETSKQTNKNAENNAQTRILIFEISQNSHLGSTQINQLAKLSLTLLK